MTWVWKLKGFWAGGVAMPSLASSSPLVDMVEGTDSRLLPDALRVRGADFE